MNFKGSSGSMEPTALVKMTHELFDSYMVRLGTLVADDDSSIRAQMKWSNADWMVHNKTNEPPRVTSKTGRVTIRPDNGKLW